MSKIVKKETPRNSPKDPPNSPMKEIAGYTYTSFSILSSDEAIRIKILNLYTNE